MASLCGASLERPGEKASMRLGSLAGTRPRFDDRVPSSSIQRKGALGESIVVA